MEARMDVIEGGSNTKREQVRQYRAGIKAARWLVK
jgi:hypothetical protein